MKRQLSWHTSWRTEAWEDYLYWQQTDKQVFKRINELIKDCLRSPFDGIGKLEALKANLRRFCGPPLRSRRITGEHRLVYKVDDERILIIQCRFHY